MSTARRLGDPILHSAHINIVAPLLQVPRAENIEALVALVPAYCRVEIPCQERQAKKRDATTSNQPLTHKAGGVILRVLSLPPSPGAEAQRFSPGEE